MKLYDFIFSSERPTKYYRHIVFWSVWLIYLIGLALFNSLLSSRAIPATPFWKILYVTFAEVGTEICCTYFIILFLIPRFLYKGKRIFFAFCTLLCLTLVFIIYYLIQTKTSDKLLFNLWFVLGNFLGIGPVFIFMLFAGIQMMKNYYLKMEERETLSRETTIAEIQALKAKVHPHFLFNTLNNIYSYIIVKPDQAASLVRKLNDMLRYMVQECKTDLIPLKREVIMLENYISLEKVRYGDRLDMQLDIKGDYHDKLIAPLLMIPFVENSFKHGVSKTRGRQWINLSVNSENDRLLFNLSNSKGVQATTENNKKGIGLANVQKRLQLLYPGNHELQIEQTENSYTVRLKVLLYDPSNVNGVLYPVADFTPITAAYV